MKNADPVLWSQLQNHLKTTFPKDVYKTWFEKLKCLEENNSCLKIGCSSEFATLWIKNNYKDLFEQHLTQLTGNPFTVLVETILSKGNESSLATPKPETKQETPLLTAKKNPRTSVLNPKYTFENFVIGSGNQLAHAACVAVAHSPGKAYNPLFLYGDTGLGKTHLMQAIAHHNIKNASPLNIVYVSTEKFTNEFINAIQENQLNRFRKRYRSIDIVLLDDIHFLSGKERIQEEFFHTFNELFESQKQICLSSDRPASEISKLENRLISRFQWGLVCDIQVPDFETRVAILAKKAEAMKLKLSIEILHFLAEKVTRNVRRMEGALTRLASYAQLLEGTVDIHLVEKWLQDIFREEKAKTITIDFIQEKVAHFYGVSRAELVGKSRQPKFVLPRQVAMYISRMQTSESLQEIGTAFGGRDHGTVIHACKSIENIQEHSEKEKRNIELIQTQIAHKS